MNDINDAAAIRELLARYALTLDVNDYDGCLELFTADAEYLVYGATLIGERIRSMFQRAPKGLHLTGAAIVAIDGDTATVRSQVLFVDSTTHQLRPAIYADDLQCCDDGWRFRRRRCQFLTPDGLRDTPSDE
jgi:hypothetical protein